MAPPLVKGQDNSPSDGKVNKPGSEYIQEPLIKTKLFVPQLRPSLVTRARLLTQLEVCIQCALTLICAPAGYGKTTLLAEFISERMRAAVGGSKGNKTAPHFCWLSLDEADNDLVRFLTYLIASLNETWPGIGVEAGDLLHSFPPPPAQTILALLINELQEIFQPICLVLDDYQFISNRAIHEGVAFLLDHLPANLHLIMATRSDPPVPLARLRAHNQLLELRADHLRFTPEETTAFLNRVMNLSLSTDEITTLGNRAEGWIAGLQMAAVSMHGRSDISSFIQAFSGSHRYILDYLTEEALDRQPENVKQFLLSTSVLDRLCASLCGAVVGENESNARTILAYLDRENLFLIALDDTCFWFRYHHLFADLLRTRLQQFRPDKIPQLHTRASEWYEKNGYLVDAIQHAFLAHEDERASALIEHYGPSRWSYGDSSVLNLVAHLPPKMLRTRPKLGLYQSWIWISQGQTRSSIALIHDLAEQIPENSTNPEERWMRTVLDLLCGYIYISGKNNQTQLPDIETLDLMPDQDLGLHNTADVLYAFLVCRRGELEPAAEVLLNCVQRDMAANGTTAIPMAIPFLARIRLMQGKLREAAKLCREYLEPMTERGKNLFYSGGSLNIVLGEVLREWNDLEAAEAQIREGLQVNDAWNNFMSNVIGYSALARVQQAKGDLKGAFETLQKLEAMLQGRSRPPDQEDELRALRVRLWLAAGDLSSAGAWADQLQMGDPFDPRYELDCISLARVRIAQGRHSEAQDILEMLAHQPDTGKRINRQIKIGLLLAVTLYCQNQSSRAFQSLESCLSLAEPDGHMRAFLDLGEPARELLSMYLRRPNPIFKTYIHKILAGFTGPSQVSVAETGQVDHVDALTPRELEVLRLMAEGFPNSQIGEQLFLTEGTVKFHVHNILGKIQVKNRSQAILQANKLKLI
jgi:LuxR family maltose regulon positive regulatory protein